MAKPTLKRIRSSLLFPSGVNDRLGFADFTIIRGKDIRTIARVSVDEDGVNEGYYDISFAIHTEKQVHYATYEGIAAALVEQAVQELERERYVLIQLLEQIDIIGVGLGLLEVAQ